MRFVVAALVATPISAAAAEVTTGVQVGYGRRLGEGAEGLSILGVRGDVLFGRDGRKDFAAGLCAGFSAPDPFHEAMGDAGISILIPALDTWPVVISAGGFVGSGAPSAGLAGRVFWGVRPHNASSFYVTTIGVFVETRAALAGAAAVDVSAGIHLDGYAFLYPFVLLWESILHGWP